MKISVLILFLLAIGCTKKENTPYLQKQNISLAQPHIKTASTIIDSSLLITATLRKENVELFYTTDGKEPTKTSSKYKAPITVTKEGIYKFKAFHPDWKPSANSELKLYKKGIAPNQINLITSAHKDYSGLGTSTLYNNIKGTLNYRSNKWIGFDSIAKATVYFNKDTYVKNLTIGYLIHTRDWIFPPSEVTLLFSNTDSISTTIDPIETKHAHRLADITIPINKKVESITLIIKNTRQLPEWHNGKGRKAWLFMDEWIFN